MNFTIFGVKIEFTVWFFAILAFLFIIDSTGLAILGILACLIHEAAHLVMMFLCKVKPMHIVFMPFGIKIKRNQSIATGYDKEILILAAGPFINFILGIFFIVLSQSEVNILSAFGVMNILLGIFNILPIGLLDGGRMLELVLLYCGKEASANKICFICSVLLLLPLFTLGIYLFLKSKYNFTLLFTVIYIFIKVFNEYNTN